MDTTKKIREFRFFFKTESVIMRYHSQNVCFNSFNIRDKRKLKNFANDIRSARALEMDDVFRMARQYNLPSISVSTSAIKHKLPIADPKRNLSRIP